MIETNKICFENHISSQTHAQIQLANALNVSPVSRYALPVQLIATTANGGTTTRLAESTDVTVVTSWTTVLMLPRSPMSAARAPTR